LKISNLARALAAVACAACFATARAEAVVIDFNHLTPGSYFFNLVEDGFRISPRCHVDISFAFDRAAGFDDSGCQGEQGFNPNFLGADPATTDLHIDRGGQSFSLLAMDWLSPGTTVELRSSKGGTAILLPSEWGWAQFDFSGDLWQGVSWIEVSADTPGEPTVWIDNIRLSVPEPHGLALTGLVLASLAATRRRHSKATGDA